MTSRPTPPRARPPGDLTSSGSTTPCPRAPARRETVPGTLSANPITPFSAAASRCAISAQGLNQRFFDNAGRKLKVGAGDTLFAYVYIDPTNPPRELMLQWHTSGGWSHRAYWGENVIDWGTDGTPERLKIGDLPASKQVGAAGSARRQAQAQAPARSSTAGRSPSTAAPSTGTRPASRHRPRKTGRLLIPSPPGFEPSAPAAARACPRT